jgi:hypothetical protein
VRPRAAGGLRRERHGDRSAHRLRGREGDRPLRGTDGGAARALAAGVDLGRSRTRAGRLRGRAALEPGGWDASAVRTRCSGGDDPDGPRGAVSARGSADATGVRRRPVCVPDIGSGMARRRAQRRARERGRTRGAPGSSAPFPWAGPSGDPAGAGGARASARQGQRQRGGRRRCARSLGPDAGR